MQQKVFVYDPTASDKLSSVRGIGRYLQILKESFPNWIFTNNLTMKQFNNETVFINPFFNFLQPPLTLYRLAKKQIAVIHDLIPLKYPNHFPAGIRGNINITLNKFALKNYDLIITDSEASKIDIINILQIDEAKIKVIYPCLPKKFTNSESKNKILNSKLNSQFSIIDSKFCLYVGDATWNKNLVNIAKAIKIANVTCIFVGKVFDQAIKVASEETLREADCRDNRQSLAEEESRERRNLSRINHPWNQELKQFIKETKDDKRFIFAGFITDSELFKLYEQASVNLLLSRAEGFGFSYLEAANFSCPSLLSDIPVLKEISEHQALFANPKNPHDIADKINEIYSKNVGAIFKSPENLRNKIGASAKKRSQFFSQKAFKKNLLYLLE